MSQCPKTTSYSKRLPEGPLLLNPTSKPTSKLSIAYLNLPKSSKTSGSAQVKSTNEYDSACSTHCYLTSQERLETNRKQRPMSTSQNSSTNTIESPFASSYYKNISKLKGQSPIASYYRCASTYPAYYKFCRFNAYVIYIFLWVSSMVRQQVD